MVVVSIDQFPYEYLVRMRSHFAPDGMFRTLCDQGANFINCNHGHAFTVTAPGHSVLLTGTFPNVTGIVDNEWFDRRTRRAVYCVEDPDYPLVGNPLPPDDDSSSKDAASKTKGSAKKPAKSKGISPRSLLAGTLGDVLKLANPQSKVFGIALKDRAGVLMAGHAADGVFWFDADTGNWITSTYYRDSLPGYLRNLNESDAAEAYLGQQWTLLLDKDKYLQYPAGGGGLLRLLPGFPHVMARQASPLYYKAMTLSPFGNQMTLDTARLLIASEKLGAGRSARSAGHQSFLERLCGACLRAA